MLPAPSAPAAAAVTARAGAYETGIAALVKSRSGEVMDRDGWMGEAAVRIGRMQPKMGWVIGGLTDGLG